MTESKISIVFPEHKIQYQEGEVDRLFIAVIIDEDNSGALLPIISTDPFLAGLSAKSQCRKVLFVTTMRDILLALSKAMNGQVVND